MRNAGRIVVTLLLACLPAWPALEAGGPRVEGGRLHFQLPDLQGRPVRSEDLKGKVLLVDLWGTWCPPCLTEIPTLVDLQDRYGEAGLAVVSIAFEREEDPDGRRAHLRRFVEEHGINYLVLDGGSTEQFDEALPAMRNVKGFPVEILIDREGNVVEARNGYGYKKRWARRLDRELAELLQVPKE